MYLKVRQNFLSFSFLSQHKKIIQKHKNIAKTLDKEFRGVYNIIIKQEQRNIK